MQALDHVLAGCIGHPILPFLWIHGEDAAVLREKDRADPTAAVFRKPVFLSALRPSRCPLRPLSLYRFGCLAIHPSKDNEKIRPLLPWEKGPDCVFGCTRPPASQPVLYETRQHVFRPLPLIQPHHDKSCQSWGELQNQKGSPWSARSRWKKQRKSAKSYDSALFIWCTLQGLEPMGPLIKSQLLYQLS